MTGLKYALGTNAQNAANDQLVEINFDGLVGPSHNYSGLSFGNLAATAHAGDIAHPREAALQGLAKMRHNLALGLVQGIFIPLPRPSGRFLGALAAKPETDPALNAAAWSASAMWAANAATVSPAPDCADGRCHLTPANLVTMPHRSHEWPDTMRQLSLIFANQEKFAVHAPVLPCFGDEGAANHMRMGNGHHAPGLEIFVYGRGGGPFPARQHEQASRAIARQHLLEPGRVIFAEQAPEAIAAGAFHNDVVAVANENVLFCHEQAFAAPDSLFAQIQSQLPGAQIIVAPAAEISLDDAVRSYLFNAQLVSLPTGGMALIVPTEASDHPVVGPWLSRMTAGNGPIQQVLPVDLRQSMANGGGPACLRLRVVADPASVDQRFLLNEQRIETIEALVRKTWPEAIAPGDLTSPALAHDVMRARQALLDTMGLAELG